MKIKLKDKNSNLPNCWKQCGASKEDWDELNSGNEIEVKSVPDSIINIVLVGTDNKPTFKKKGDK